MAKYQKLVDRLKGYLEDLRDKKEAEIRNKEDEIDARREVQKKNGRRVEGRRNKVGDQKEQWR